MDANTSAWGGAEHALGNHQQFLLELRTEHERLERILTQLSAQRDPRMHKLEAELAHTVAWLRATLDRTTPPPHEPRDEQRAVEILETITDSVVAFDRDWRYTYLNDAAEQMYGRTRQEVLGRVVWEVFPNLIGTLFARQCHRAMDERTTIRFQEPNAVFGIWVEITAHPVGAGISCIARDISEQKRMQEAVPENQRFIQQVAELTPVVLDVFDLATEHHIYFSSDTVHLFGFTPAEIAAMNDQFSVLTHPEDLPRLGANLERLKRLADDEINEFECRIRHRNGEWRWARTRTKVFARNDEGQVRQIVSATFDVTERKVAAEQLRKSEERFRRSFELGLIGIALTSPTKGFVEVNDQICAILGYERHELLHLTWAELTHPDDLAADIAEFERVMTGHIDGYRLDKRWIRKDGSCIDSTIAVKAVGSADGTVDYFVTLLQDITERKRTEKALRESYDELERRVAERTAALVQAYDTLQMEVVERRAAEEANRNLLHQLVTAQEQERSRLSRELHDQLGQQLTALRFTLTSLAQPAGNAPIDQAVYKHLDALVEDLGREIHTLAWELRPPTLDDLGLRDALVNLVERWQAQGTVIVDMHTDRIGETRLSPVIEIALYRVVQEALTNIRRHAEARTVSIILEVQHHHPAHIRLIIEDDGHGFDAEAALRVGDAQGGLGLRGMRERIAQVGGALLIESAPQAGTTLFVRIPVQLAPPPNEETDGPT